MKIHPVRRHCSEKYFPFFLQKQKLEYKINKSRSFTKKDFYHKRLLVFFPAIQFSGRSQLNYEAACPSDPRYSRPPPDCLNMLIFLLHAKTQAFRLIPAAAFQIFVSACIQVKLYAKTYRRSDCNVRF